VNNGYRHRKTWGRHAVALLGTAVLVHVLAVWSVPYLIMHVLMDGPDAQAMHMHNRAAFPEPVSAKDRTVVMPSPDLLYSVCVYDLSNGPVRISAALALTSYWSIALYGANSDNFYVVNDRTAAGKPVNLWLVPRHGDTPPGATDDGAQVVVSPTTKGFLLMRVLTGDYEAEKAVVEPARRTLVCNQA
jgi:uncharacterized membrane protein